MAQRTCIGRCGMWLCLLAALVMATVSDANPLLSVLGRHGSGKVVQQSSVEATHEVATASATLQHRANSSSVPVPFYFTFPADFAAGAAPPPRQPLVFLMNGFSVEASRYSGVLTGLAARGFVVAASDYYRNWTEPPFPPFPRPGCPPGYVLVTAGLLGTLLDFAKGAAAEDAKFGFLRSADLGRVVLLAHSAGGSVAMHMLSDSCGHNASLSPTMQLGCEGLAALRRRHGSTLINGVVAFEGYDPQEDAHVPDGAFALYMAGQYNKRTAKKAAATTGACHGYLQFNKMNHFGINDYYPNTHQVTPCASPNPSDDQMFETDAATQRAGLDLIAGTTAAWVRAFNEGDAAAREYVGALNDNTRVSEAMTSPGCGFDRRSSDA